MIINDSKCYSEVYQNNAKNFIKNQYEYLENIAWDILKNRLIIFYEQKHTEFEEKELLSINITFDLASGSKEIDTNISFDWDYIDCDLQDYEIENERYIYEKQIQKEIEEHILDIFTELSQSKMSKINQTTHLIEIPTNRYKITIEKYFDLFFSSNYKALKENKTITQNINKSNKKNKIKQVL